MSDIGGIACCAMAAAGGLGLVGGLGMFHVEHSEPVLHDASGDSASPPVADVPRGARVIVGECVGGSYAVRADAAVCRRPIAVGRRCCATGVGATASADALRRRGRLCAKGQADRTMRSACHRRGGGSGKRYHSSITTCSTRARSQSWWCGFSQIRKRLVTVSA